MPSRTPDAVRTQIEQGKTDPVYVLLGADETEKVGLAGAFAEAVDVDLRAFNVERLYGGEIRAADVLDAARTLPLMTSRRIVIVLHAERLLEPKRDSRSAQEDLEILEAYLESPERHATIVFLADDLDKRRRLTRLLGQHATIVVCGAMASEADARRWIRDQVAKEGTRIQPDAVEELVDRAGTDIARLRGDLERLLLYAHGEPAITASHVEEVASAATSRHAFAMTDAMQQGAVAEALRELALLLDAGAVPYMVLGQLGWFVRTKVAASRLPGAVEAVLRTDVAIKSSGGDPRLLLERLVVELCDHRLRPAPARPVLRG